MLVPRKRSLRGFSTLYITLFWSYSHSCPRHGFCWGLLNAFLSAWPNWGTNMANIKYRKTNIVVSWYSLQVKWLSFCQNESHNSHFFFSPLCAYTEGIMYSTVWVTKAWVLCYKFTCLTWLNTYNNAHFFNALYK